MLENWELIEQRYSPMLGSRNHDLCDFIAYSTCRFSNEVSLELARLMRELWDPVYNDSMDQHMYEANKQWDACEYSFRAILTDFNLVSACQYAVSELNISWIFPNTFKRGFSEVT